LESTKKKNESAKEFFVKKIIKSKRWFTDDPIQNRILKDDREFFYGRSNGFLLDGDFLIYLHSAKEVIAQSLKDPQKCSEMEFERHWRLNVFFYKCEGKENEGLNRVLLRFRDQFLIWDYLKNEIVDTFNLEVDVTENHVQLVNDLLLFISRKMLRIISWKTKQNVMHVLIPNLSTALLSEDMLLVASEQKHQSTLKIYRHNGGNIFTLMETMPILLLNNYRCFIKLSIFQDGELFSQKNGWFEGRNELKIRRWRWNVKTFEKLPTIRISLNQRSVYFITDIDRFKIVVVISALSMILIIDRKNPIKYTTMKIPYRSVSTESIDATFSVDLLTEDDEIDSDVDEDLCFGLFDDEEPVALCNEDQLAIFPGERWLSDHSFRYKLIAYNFFKET